MNLDRWVIAAAATGLVAIAACGGTKAEPKPDAVPAATPEPAAAAPAPATDGVAWKDMKRAARIEHMKHVVLPTMKPLFAAFEPDEFADFKCVNCHGAGVADKTYEMPNPKLPRLPADAEGFKKLAEEEADAVKFMSGTVVPRMAAMLGEQPYDPATKGGFGCFRCHTPKK